MPNSSFVSDLATSTFGNKKKEITDNISDSNLTLNTFIGKKVDWTGGTQSEYPIYYRFNTTAGYHAGPEVLDTTTQNNHTMAVFQPCFSHVGISIDGPSIRKNRGKSQVIKLMDMKVTDATAAAKDVLNRSFFSDGTAHAGLEFIGFEGMISTTGTYGGINRSTDAYWQAKVNSTGGVLTLDMMRTQNRSQARGSDEADLIITSGVLRDKYESLLFPSLRLTSQAKGNATFKTLAFNSSDAMVGYDEACPSGTVYFINTDYIKFEVDPENFLSTTPFTQIGDNNQDAITSLMLTYCMLTCSRPEAQGKITSVTV